jgi:uncharacterized secreted protein with C-terminal beta-propeller domain
MNKKLIAVLTAVLLIVMVSSGVSAAGTENEISIYLEGEKIEFPDAGPIHTGTRVLVPVRGFFERIGVTVDWNSVYRTVIIKDESREIMLEAGNNAVLNSGEVQYLDCSVLSRDNRTYIPLRYISESFGYSVEWDGKTQSVYVSREKQQISGQTVGPAALPTLNDLESFYHLLKYNGYMYKYLYGGNIIDMIATDVPAVKEESSAAAQDSPAASTPQSKPADDYSGTNNQVEGVEEGDLVKTDGKYLYIVRNNEIMIVNADPGDLKVASRISRQSRISEMYIHNGKLVVICGNSGFIYNVGETVKNNLSEILFNTADIRSTNVAVYDISDRTAPVLVSDKEYEGNYISSRMIGNDLYMVTNAGVRFFSSYINNKLTDIVCRNDKKAFIDEMKSDPAEEAMLLQQTGFRDSGELFDAIRAVLGEYIVPRFKDNKTGSILKKELKEIAYFTDMVRPYYMITVGIDLDSGSEDIDVYLGSTGTVYASEDHLYTALAAYEYNALKSRLQRFPSYDYFTAVHRFDLKDGEIAYDSKGRVPGQILNQFSMDEYDGYFRIATTSGWSTGNSENNVYTLDKNMEVAGRLEGIAKGEIIYSTRFAGERIYMVTFRQTDPFFVIDAADPEKLSVLGYLKIPGFSTYMHILDRDHVLGFGYDAEETGGWRAGTTGFKLSLFDVSDVSKPIEIKKEVIGSRAESLLDSDHKALMISLGKGIMGFPVNYINSDSDYFAGYYVYNVSGSDFSLRGRVTHVRDNATMMDITEDDLIVRGLYIGDSLYTISKGRLQVNDLDTLKLKGYLRLK